SWHRAGAAPRRWRPGVARSWVCDDRAFAGGRPGRSWLIRSCSWSRTIPRRWRRTALLSGHDHRLRAASRGCVGERLRGAREREARGEEPADAERRHQRERPAEGGAPAERTGDPDLTEVHVPEAHRDLAALGADADELQDAGGLDERHGLGDELGLADRL